MSALLIDLKPGDEVIMPSYTFVSTANAVLLRNAKIVFAEIEKDTLNIDPTDIEKKITERTKAIYPVHYAGVSCNMDEIQKISDENNLVIVEDAAQGVNAKYKDDFLGTIGTIGCYSFHETKNYICGEGGAILINKEEYIDRAEIIREKGTNRNKFFRGEIDKYTWIDLGSSYIGSDLLAAYLYAQFENLDEIQKRRETIYDRYYKGLVNLEEEGLIRLPIIPSYSKSNYHMFYIILKNESLRNKLLKRLKQLKIGAVFHYIPLHLSPMGTKLGYNKGDFPLTEDISNRLVRLPMYYELSDSEVDYIIK
ncbi:MAG: dTDP-4-amino-4,6-dideoxygalactose transaminase, partial [Candidatus Lokiarchaeota archaeon]